MELRPPTPWQETPRRRGAERAGAKLTCTGNLFPATWPGPPGALTISQNVLNGPPTATPGGGDHSWNSTSTPCRSSPHRRSRPATCGTSCAGNLPGHLPPPPGPW